MGLCLRDAVAQPPGWTGGTTGATVATVVAAMSTATVPVVSPPVRRIVPRNPADAAAGPWRLGGDLWQHRHLLGQLVRRDAIGRYRGNYLGVLWSFLNPLLLLAIFTMVFRLIFKGKFSGRPDEGPGDFALQLFAGLIIFSVMAECISRAPSLLLLHANYVKKIVFPLELLPVMMVLSSLFHLLISLIPLGVAELYLHGGLPAGAAWWPLLMVPLCALSLGVGWLLSALGVFLRDLGQIAIALTQILMYASAVFYSSARVPPEVQPFVRGNPLAFLCEQSREVFVWGAPMDWSGYGWTLLVSLVVMFLGYAVFMRVRHAFADVV